MRPTEYGPITDGLQAQVALARRRFIIGEPIEAVFRVRNVSRTDRTIWHSGFWPNHLVFVKDARGREAPLTEQGRTLRAAFSPGGERTKNYPVVLAPGTVDATEGGYDLTRLVDLTRPGLYTVQIVYEEAQSGWKGRLFSHPVSFRVLAPLETKLSR